MSSQSRAQIEKFYAEEHRQTDAIPFPFSTHPSSSSYLEREGGCSLGLFGGEFFAHRTRRLYGISKKEAGMSTADALIQSSYYTERLYKLRGSRTSLFRRPPKKLSQISWQVYHPDALSKLHESLLTHTSLTSPISTQTICNPNSFPVRTGPAPITSHTFI